MNEGADVCDDFGDESIGGSSNLLVSVEVRNAYGNSAALATKQRLRLKLRLGLGLGLRLRLRVE